MNRFITLSICCFLTFGSAMAQDRSVLKPQVSRCVYHDVSPPLRDMVKMAPQKADNSWKDGIVKNNLYPFGVPKDMPLNAPDHTIQNHQGTSTADSLLLSFDGVGNLDNVFPPDTDGDVGPHNYFQVVNLHFAIYDKAGNKLIGPSLNSSMFNGFPNNANSGDAVVLYDEASDRWIFSQFSLPNYPNGPFYEMVAVSATGDPTGSWYRYQFKFTDMPDYPKLGVWPDGIYMTTNRFSAGSTSYMGTGAAAFDKESMYAGSDSAQMVFFTLPGSYDAYSVLPSDCDGVYPPAGTPNFFAWLGSGNINIYGFQVDWSTPTNSTYSLLCNIPVSAYSGSISGIKQKGTTAKVDPIAGRLMFRLPFRKFSDHWAMVCNATVNVGGNAAVRWWELRNSGSNPAGWSKYQESTFVPDTNNRWMGSKAIDALNNIALGYSLSGSSVYPSVYYAGRTSSDPLNTLSIGEKSIVDGSGCQTYSGNRSRWGDYSAMNADPSAPGKFWYTQEYYQTTSSTGWKTRIGAFSFGSSLMATVSAAPSLICFGDSSQLNIMASGGSSTYTYSWTSNPAGYTSTEKNPWVHPLVSTIYKATVSDGTNSIVDSVLVTVQIAPVANAGNDTTYCNYVPVITVHGSGAGYSLGLWSTLGDGYFDDPSAMVTQYYPMASDKANGVALVLQVLALQPCHGVVGDTVFIKFDPCTGVLDQQAGDLSIDVQPNPSNGTFDLNIDNLLNQTADVVVTDLQGHSVYHQAFQAAGNSLKDRLNLSFLPKGSYILKVKTDTRSKIGKIIIQ